MRKPPKLQIKLSPSFVDQVCSKAIELLKEGKTVGVIDPAFGGLSVFIDKEPSKVLMVVPMESLPVELLGRAIYVGGEY